jgi:hypothetical protein
MYIRRRLYPKNSLVKSSNAMIYASNIDLYLDTVKDI